MAEGEVRAADQVAGAETLVEYIGDEGFGGHQAEGVVEREFVEQGYAECGEGFGAFRGEGEAEGWVVGAEVFARVGFEGEHAERDLGAGGVGGADDLGVAFVHAVEIAEGDGGAFCVGRQIAPVVEDAHQDREGTWT